MFKQLVQGNKWILLTCAQMLYQEQLLQVTKKESHEHHLCICVQAAGEVTFIMFCEL